ncbi:hypothetical protein ACC794_37585, partial [Rhizobium ruizarguesonis]
LFIRLRDIEDILALPRQALSAEQVQLVQAWAADCHVGGAGDGADFAELDPPSQQPPVLTARFELTEADRAAGLSWQMQRPGMKR